jgi:hypothetical protein
MSNHIIAFESDAGTTRPLGFGFNGGEGATYQFFFYIIT